MARRPRIYPEAHPRCWPCDSASRSATRKIVMVHRPDTSIDFSAAGRSRGIRVSGRMVPSTPLGSARKKMARQLSCCTRYPPTDCPSVGPREATIINRPIAKPRCSAGKASYSITMPILMTEAPATPCTTRKAIRDSILQARPQSTVDTVVPSTPSTYTFRCPS